MVTGSETCDSGVGPLIEDGGFEARRGDLGRVDGRDVLDVRVVEAHAARHGDREPAVEPEEVAPGRPRGQAEIPFDCSPSP